MLINPGHLTLAYRRARAVNLVAERRGLFVASSSILHCESTILRMKKGIQAYTWLCCATQSQICKSELTI